MLKSWWKTEEIDEADLDDVISIDSDIEEEEQEQKQKIYDNLLVEINKMEDEEVFITEQPLIHNLKKDISTQTYNQYNWYSSCILFIRHIFRV